MTPSNVRALTLLSLALAAAPALVSQESTGTITGTVQARGGQPVADAEIRISGPQLQGVRVLRTDASGSFRAPLLPPGAYRIAVLKPGHVAPAVAVTLGLGQVLHQVIAIVPEAAATVEVVADASAVDKTDVKSQTNIPSELMDLLPRASRSMDSIALLSPGVTTGVGDRIQIRGAMTHQNRFLLNGTDIADNLSGQATGAEYYVEDNLQEIQVIQSPVNARYGNFSGGVINAVTKSGGNEFTGVVRGSFTRASWSAQAPRGDQPNTKPANAGTLTSEDELTRKWTVTLGGPIIKDRLWFSLSTKQDPSSLTPRQFSDVRNLTLGDFSGGAALGSGATGPVTVGGVTYTPASPYYSKADTKFYEGKLTFAINPFHTLELAGNNNRQDDRDRPPSTTFDARTLETYTTINTYLTLAYRGILGQSVTIESRASKKHNQILRGGDPAKGSPVRVYYSDGGLRLFNNAMYDRSNGAENRDIYTYLTNVQWFSPPTAWGVHMVDAGFEFLRHERRAPNSPSATGVQLIVWGINPDGTFRVAPRNSKDPTGVRNRIYLIDTDGGTAYSDMRSFFINDIWSINQNFQVSAGLRWDGVKAYDTLSSPTMSSDQISPRLQGTWDIRGDQSLILRTSAARYVGKLVDSYTNKFTRAGTFFVEIYNWKPSVGALNNATLAQISDINNWDISAAGNYGNQTTANRFGDRKSKAPYMEELGLELKRGWKTGSFISLAYAQRRAGNFFNDFFEMGEEVVIPLKYAQTDTWSAKEMWRTDNAMRRDYKSLEFQFLAKLDKYWSFGGNWTYAIMKGNTEGAETSSEPVFLDPIGNFDAVHQKYGRDLSYYSPYGYMTGDIRHRGNLYLSYLGTAPGGTSLYGSLLFNYRGGGSYSLVRTVKFEVPDERNANPTLYRATYGEFGTYDRYYGPRGLGRFNDIFNFDLKLGWEIPVWRKMRFFTEATVYNVFNHCQLRSYSTSSNQGTTLYTSNPLAGYSATARRVLTNGDVTGYGATSYANFTGGRSVWLSTGVKW
ncbi:MAG: carboxypeptidase regulatory-like domain-containing protein [Acidobacteria bacterium]|nr:carboxypeptidase regulatory-like domain-containing protein [Acidobacteriota bacterium]